MSSAKPEFSISPLFYDALSMEFQPATDPRLHTIGRLCAATVLKGNFILVKDDSIAGRLATYRYLPSWAPRKMCTVTASFVGENHVLMNSVQLDQPWGHDSLTIVRDTLEDGEGITISQDGSTDRYEIELGEPLALARELVRISAQTFFAKD